MKAQEYEGIGMNAKKTGNLSSGKKGILKEQSGDEKIPNLDEGRELIERVKIEGAPIEVIGSSEVGYWASMGLFRLTEKRDTIEEVKYEVEERGWEIMINVMCAIMAGRDMEIIEASKKNEFNQVNK